MLRTKVRLTAEQGTRLKAVTRRDVPASRPGRWKVPLRQARCSLPARCIPRPGVLGVTLPGSHFDLVDLPHVTPQSLLPAGGCDDSDDSEDGW